MDDDRDLREEFISCKEVFSGALIRVEHMQVLLPDGNTALREIVRHIGAVGIVPLDENGNVTLVRQHRVAIDKITLEIPAGKLDFPGEDPASAAVRELEEETGLRTSHWQLLTKLNSTAGFCDECIVLYMATLLSQFHSHTDEDEFLHLVKMPLTKAVQMVMSGEIQDAKTIAGLLMAQNLYYTSCNPGAFTAPSTKRTAGSLSSRQAENS
ncbi:MAG: ADP-ribose pyrophosphatase [Clostridiales bacterium]|nr:ADP-ribose pyrophosphatase [Clostridiales bacterium]